MRKKTFALIGTETLVIADDRKVIERLVDEYDAEGYKEIEVSEIPEFWKKSNYRGTVYLYVNNLEKKRKVEEELKKASRTEKQRAPWLTKGWEIVEVKPVGVRTKRYWKRRDSVIFEEDIRKNPGLYKEDEIDEIRQIAVSVLREQKIAKKLSEQAIQQRMRMNRNVSNDFELSL